MSTWIVHKVFRAGEPNPSYIVEWRGIFIAFAHTLADAIDIARHYHIAI